jgi:alkylhydroperoxidase family enzyme
MHGRHVARSGDQLVEESLARAAMHGRIEQLRHDPRFTERERAALRYADAMWHDHHALPDDLWAELMRVFSPEEFVELGMAVANYKGMGQLFAMLGIPAPEEWVAAIAAARSAGD